MKPQSFFHSLKELEELVTRFRDERGWKKYHNPKDLAMAITVESSELLDLFKWKTLREIYELIKGNEGYVERIKEEVADVIIYCLQFCNICGIDVFEAVKEKIAKNSRKYPVEKFKEEKDWEWYENFKLKLGG